MKREIEIHNGGCWKKLAESILSADQFHELKPPPREFVISPFLKTGDFGILAAKRGVGKTWLVHLIARGASQGTSVGLWTCPRPFRVLLVDGEMPLELTQHRDIQFAKENDHLFFLHHQVVFDRTGADLDLTSPMVQHALEGQCLEREIELLILDNQSALLRGVSEGDPDSWNLVLPFLLRLQRRGIAVLLVVHAGRNNQPRGYSRREDRTAFVLSLSDRKDEADDGAKLVSEFTKPSRNCPASETPALLWEFTRDGDGRTRYTCKVMTKLDQFRQCL